MRKFCLLVVMALCGLGVSAQGVLNVRINEVLVLNENDIVDDYGCLLYTSDAADD